MTTTQTHSPTTNRTPENKVAQQECWANFSATFMTTNGRAFLQPGQFLPIWSRTGKGREWRCKTPFTLTVISAFVIGGRYMIKGGDKKLSSHPLIEDWEDSPIRGAAAELRFPGGLRRLHVSNTPAIVANAGNFETARVSAKAFHDNFANAQIRNGCPIVIACRHDACEKQVGAQYPAIDICRGEALTVFELPFPIITSDEEEVVLKDYSVNWTNALKDYCDTMGVTEIGVLYSADDNDDVVEDISTERPNLVYRNALNKDDLGFSTLDPNLYERMLPFASGRFDVDLLPRI